MRRGPHPSSSIMILHVPGSILQCLYSTDPVDLGRSIALTEKPDGKHVVELTILAAGFVIFR
jgi:hypothetical protein